MAAPEAESELAVGFFGSRYERATPAEREYLRAMADVAAQPEGANPLGENGSSTGEGEAAPGQGADLMDAGVPTAAIAEMLRRKPQSLSPARDALIKKGLVYSGQRGRIAFTVPHFGRYLRSHPGE